MKKGKEEVVKALRRCDAVTQTGRGCGDCPYKDVGLSCTHNMIEDAIVYILGEEQE